MTRKDRTTRLLPLLCCALTLCQASPSTVASSATTAAFSKEPAKQSPNDAGFLQSSLTLSMLRHKQDAHRRLAEAGHLQSGPDFQGHSFASSGVVDTTTQTLHIVGTTYGDSWGGVTQATPSDPACFYAVAQLPQGAGDSRNMAISWLHTEVWGLPSTEEGCRDLLVDPIDNRVYIVGHSDTDGLLAEFFNSGGLGAENIQQVGQILDFSTISNKDPLSLEGGRVIQDFAADYPVAIAGGAGSNKFYVASLFSDVSAVNSDWPTGNGPPQTDPSLLFHYGEGFSMAIREYNRNYNGQIQPGGVLRRSVEPGHEEVFSTKGGEAVHVSALLELPGRLVVAGHTAGPGDGFNSTGQIVDGTVDGFVTQLSLQTLDIVANTPTFRIRSDNRDDHVTGACFSSSDAFHVYVTGYTSGSIEDPAAADPLDDSIRAYVLKLKLNDMTTVWVTEFDAQPGTGEALSIAKATSCVLTEDGNNLYVGGVVEAGGVMEYDIQLFAVAASGGSMNVDVPPESFGGTDVWVAQLDSMEGSNTEGKIKYLRQFGSDADDTIAARGGLQVDEEGNAVLLGNTGGSIYRDRGANDQNYIDVFIATFSVVDGSFVIPLEHDDFVSLPPQLPPQNTPAPVPSGTPPPTPVSSTPKAPTQAPTSKPTAEGSSKFPIYSAVLLFVLVVLIAIFMIRVSSVWNFSGPKKDVPTDRSKVLLYLHDFDVEDIELKHSATGGWHCSYMNNLSKGVNKQVKHDAYYSPTSSPSRSGAGSAYDPLNVRRGPQQGDEPERFADEILSVDGDDDEGISFGSARSSRRRGGFDGLLRGSTGEKRKSRRSRHRATNSGDSLSSSSASSASRRNRARERWQNREVLS